MEPINLIAFFFFVRTLAIVGSGSGVRGQMLTREERERDT